MQKFMELQKAHYYVDFNFMAYKLCRLSQVLNDSESKGKHYVFTGNRTLTLTISHYQNDVNNGS